jgi:hypothetical protein
LKGSALDDLAILEHQHQVGVADGAQAVGDHKEVRPCQQLFQRLLD